MSEFGTTLFGGGRFIRWSLSPILLVFAGAMPFLMHSWSPKAIAALAGLEITSLALLAGFWLPAHVGRVCFRVVTALVFLAYAIWLVEDLWTRASTRKLPEALPGFLAIGLPCLWYSLLGRFAPTAKEGADWQPTNTDPPSSELP